MQFNLSQHVLHTQPSRCSSAAGIGLPARHFARLPCRATSDAESSSASRDGNVTESEASTSSVVNPNLKLPKTGYFSIADTTAEVYSKAGSDPFDPAKKPGRYQPEFIWNTDWQTALEREEQLRRKMEEEKAKPKVADSGFLSFSRISEYDRLDVDLSDVLARKRREDAELAEALARQPAKPAAPAPKQRTGPRPMNKASATAPVKFTRKEAARLSRTQRALERSAVTVMTPVLTAEQAKEAEEERRIYAAMVVEQQVWTIAFSVAGVAITYATYSSDISASYLVGALGGFAYLRLLSKSVDAVGVSGMGSQPRLLIPIILGLGYNRFNQLYSEQLGVTLELLPILVGFLTYKVAVIARQYKDVFDKM